MIIDTNCETTGCNDITLATVKNPAAARRSFSYQRLANHSRTGADRLQRLRQLGLLNAVVAKKARFVRPTNSQSFST